MDLRYSKLEKRCNELETVMKENGDIQGLLERLKERDAEVIVLSEENKELKKENVNLKVKLQKSQSELSSQELQINQFVNLQVEYEDVKQEIFKQQRKF